jgi:hypothetical protein
LNPIPLESLVATDLPCPGFGGGGIHSGDGRTSFDLAGKDVSFFLEYQNIFPEHENSAAECGNFFVEYQYSAAKNGHFSVERKYSTAEYGHFSVEHEYSATK